MNKSIGEWLNVMFRWQRTTQEIVSAHGNGVVLVEVWLHSYTGVAYKNVFVGFHTAVQVG